MIMVHRSFIAHAQPPTVIHPPETAFDLPALAITWPGLDRRPPFRFAPLAAFKGRDGRLDAPAAQALAEGLAVIGSVRHQCFRSSAWAAASLRHAPRGQGRLHQLALMGWGTLHVHAHRPALALGPHHHLRARADVGLADAGPPVVAGTNLPSKNACAHSSLPWAFSWLSKARQLCSQVPSAAQFRKRRQHVAGEPYVRDTAP